MHAIGRTPIMKDRLRSAGLAQPQSQNSTQEPQENNLIDLGEPETGTMETSQTSLIDFYEPEACITNTTFTVEPTGTTREDMNLTGSYYPPIAFTIDSSGEMEPLRYSIELSSPQHLTPGKVEPQATGVSAEPVRDYTGESDTAGDLLQNRPRSQSQPNKAIKVAKGSKRSKTEDNLDIGVHAVQITDTQSFISVVEHLAKFIARTVNEGQRVSKPNRDAVTRAACEITKALEALKTNVKHGISHQKETIQPLQPARCSVPKRNESGTSDCNLASPTQTDSLRGIRNAIRTEMSQPLLELTQKLKELPKAEDVSRIFEELDDIKLSLFTAHKTTGKEGSSSYANVVGHQAEEVSSRPFTDNEKSDEDDVVPITDAEKLSVQLCAQGVRLANEGELDEALKVLNRGVEAAPERAEPYNDRAQLLRLMKRDDGKTLSKEAMADLDRAIQLTEGRKNKARALALCQRGVLLRKRGGDARAPFVEAAKLGSGFAKKQVVELNPYAALCNQMLSEVMRGGEVRLDNIPETEQ